MVRHLERKAISLQIYNRAQKNILHSLHLFSAVSLHGMALVVPYLESGESPLSVHSVIVSFIDSRESIFRLPGTTNTIITATSRLTH
jgi:hypothetical protein